MKYLQTAGLVATLGLVGVLLVSMLSSFGGASETVPAPAVAVEFPAERIRVEVLNAAGVPGLARSATRVLRERGFDVVFFGNAPGGVRDSSAVLDRVDRPRAAGQVADALRIRTVRAEPDTSLYLEATVILGKDWERELFP